MSYSASDFVNDIEQGMTDHNIPELDRAAWCEMAGEEPDENDEDQDLRILAERACGAIAKCDQLRAALENVWNRMDRARSLLITETTPWKMLDTSLDRAALANARQSIDWTDKDLEVSS